MESLSLTLLGSFSGTHKGQPLPGFRTKATLALLIYLACQPNQPQRREHLMTLLWPGLPQKSAQANLRQTLYQLRQAIPETAARENNTPVPLLLSSRQTIQINPAAEISVDVLEFDANIRQGEPGYTAAIDLYQGNFLSDFYLPDSQAFEEWTLALRQQLRGKVLMALEKISEKTLKDGGLETAEFYTRRELAIDNLRESAHRRLMRILSRTGARAAALAHYEELVELFREDLAVEPSVATQQLYESIRSDSLPTQEPSAKRTADKPAATFFRPPLTTRAGPIHGRERELHELKALLLEGQSRVISVIGPGGIGKTRLALEVAHQLNDQFPEGAVFVPLAPLQAESDVIPTIAQSLGFAFQGGNEDAKSQLLNFLSGKKMLLVLDNYEHLLNSAPLVAEMSGTAEHLKILVTSREKLKLQFEQIYPLQSMLLTDWDTVEEAIKNPAVRLFVEYGQRVRPAFELRIEELDSLRQIMHLVDGMPLAIILASAWLELLKPGEIAAEIRKNIRFLEADFRDLPERQRSMKAVFETTWSQLNEQEQEIFAALSVFHGGFTRDAAQKVAGASPRHLLSLVGRSLLAREETGRFVAHELLRQFAKEHLAHSSIDEITIRDRHSSYYMVRLQSSEDDLKGPLAEETIKALRDDVQNIYQGWNWSVSQRNFEHIGPCVFAFATLISRLNQYETGLDIFERTTNEIREHIRETDPVEPATRIVQIRLLAYQSDLLREIDDIPSAEAFGQEAMNLLNRSELQAIDIRRVEALVLKVLAWVYNNQNRYDEGFAMLEKALSILDEAKDSWEVAQIYQSFGGSALRQANFTEAVRFHTRSLMMFEEIGHHHSIAWARMILGFELGAMGKFDEAENIMRSSIKAFQEINDFASVADASGFLSEILIYRGKFEEAKTIAEQDGQIIERPGFEDNAIYMRRYWAAYHLGEFDRVLRGISAPLNIAMANDLIMRAAMFEFSTGCANLGLGRIKASRENLERSVLRLRKINAPDYLTFTLTALCCTYILEEELAEAGAVLVEAIRIAKELDIEIYFTLVVASAALLMLARGDTEQAVELYALAKRNPYVANSQWYEEIIGRPITEATTTLPLENVTAAEERGRSLDLRQTTESRLHQLSPS